MPSLPYFPPKYLQETPLPLAFERDLQFQLRLMREKWHRFYPPVDYYKVIRPTAIAQPDADKGGLAPTATEDPSGAAFDRLWGEGHSRETAVSGSWRQPHGDDDYEATTEHERYEGPYTLPMQIRREVKEKELKLYGFDEMRDFICTVPRIVLDDCGIRVEPGDKWIWDGNEVLVMQVSSSPGFWKNSNVRLYEVFDCEYKRLGS